MLSWRMNIELIGKRGLPAALLAIAGASFVLAPSLRAASAAPRCSTRGLVVWLDTQGDGTAGTVYHTIELTNLSGHACALSGYPGVSAVDLAGRQLGDPAAPDGSSVRSVTLGSGKTAHAVLGIDDAGNYPASRCGKVTAAGLRIYPPGQ